ncbi:hypothetical protein AQ619_07945 [Caulobacter henricii]|uniref:MAPEG family protein n=2 Tax=Caulobacter henricii TaxID=69395 RepID=A0A0P0NYP8_9CAUL|nr:MAPEG family protein [Caulobacter henricii]ALL13289.1 hypothetical protein AQ619_07945 [Caulobacter henricii]
MRMAFELQMVGVAVLIGLVHLLCVAVIGDVQRGLKWSAGPRDARIELTGLGGRLERAWANFCETFPLFVAAVVVTYLGGRIGVLTSIGALLYVVGRVAYLPLYAFGVPWLRSVAWFVSLFGIIAILLALVV